ncbi:MAG TPA: VTT domain-containing protein [Aromatoleum sp.]|uniref:TVP38/TMEM64 family protein n=1 Tax=Aromatoleum sp. TaxID=2307007 RepID=UPI002B469193|nr:VTT domain-containing protein [Aromatoleum sp.]HJV26797.1 VTT domain-containing protein [Aromatoleum sp.]
MDGQTRETGIGRHRRLIAVVLFLVALFAAAELSGLRDHFNLAFLRQRLDEHLAGGLAIFTLLFVLGNLIQIPGWIFLAAAVLALGRTWGGIATYLAANVSCAITFFTIRWMGGDALRRLKGRTAVRLLGELHAHPIRSIVLLRTLFQTLPALNYALALSGVGFGTYMVGTLLGLPLPIAAYCVFFDYLAGFIRG